jgi:hypothetical protein
MGEFGTAFRASRLSNKEKNANFGAEKPVIKD